MKSSHCALTHVALPSSRIFFVVLGICASATAEIVPKDFTPYQPVGPVVGDFVDVTSFPPKVVLNFLGGCANVTIADLDSCIVSSFANLRVASDLNDTFTCSSCKKPPNITNAQIEASALEALTACAALGEPLSMSHVDELTQQYKDIASSTCWDLLRKDDAHLFIEATWMKTCASTNLPYPIPADGMNMFSIESVHHRSILTCMLDNVFEADHRVFGLPLALDGSPESCFAPGYANITSICTSVIGPKAVRRCLGISPTNDDGDDFPPNPPLMSMDYSGDDATIFIGEFCDFLESLSTDVGRVCLLDLCESNPTSTPSKSPPSAPSSEHPTSPSRAPFSPSTQTSPSPAVTRPVTAPAFYPSSSPSLSQFPSTDAVQAFVSVEVFLTTTLNVTLDDVPSGDRGSFIDVIEMAIESIVSGRSTATVHLPSGHSRIRRLTVGNSLVLEVKVLAIRDCSYVDCAAFGRRVVDGIEETIKAKVSDGGLVESMHAIATTKAVAILETAVIQNINFLNETVTVDSVVATDERSSAASSMVQMSGFTAAVVFFLLI